MIEEKTITHGDAQVDEMRDAAQQFFEASVENFGGNVVQRATYVAECLNRWSWLRPNRWTESTDDP